MSRRATAVSRVSNKVNLVLSFFPVPVTPKWAFSDCGPLKEVTAHTPFEPKVVANIISCASIKESGGVALTWRLRVEPLLFG